MLVENVGFNSLDLAKYVYTIVFYICIELLLRLALFGHLSAQSFPPMVFLIYVFSIQASHCEPEMHLSLCCWGNFENVNGGKGWTGLGTDVFFSFFSLLLTSCIRTVRGHSGGETSQVLKPRNQV